MQGELYCLNIRYISILDEEFKKRMDENSELVNAIKTKFNLISKSKTENSQKQIFYQKNVLKLYLFCFEKNLRNNLYSSWSFILSLTLPARHFVALYQNNPEPDIFLDNLLDKSKTMQLITLLKIFVAVENPKSASCNPTLYT